METFIILLIGGFVGGFFGASVGSAGLVSVPLLILLGFSPHVAVASTRPAAFLLEVTSALRYWKEGTLTRVLFRRGVFLGIFGILGGMIGATIISTVSDGTLRLLFALVIASMSIFLFTRRSWGLVEHPQKQERLPLLCVGTFFVGIYGGFFGFSFGTLMTILLVAFGYTLLQSAALSRLIGVFTSFSTTFIFAFQGTIHYPSALAIGIGFAFGGWLGAGVGAKQGSKYIKILLFAVVVLSVVKLVYDSVLGI